MEQAALERQKRLEALRNNIVNRCEDSPDPTEDGWHDAEHAQAESIEPSSALSKEPNEFGKTLEDVSRELLANNLTARLPFEEDESVPLSELASTKANLDLKRDLERKISVLDERTSAAINQLIRQRLEHENAVETLADGK